MCKMYNRVIEAKICEDSQNLQVGLFLNKKPGCMLSSIKLWILL